MHYQLCPKCNGQGTLSKPPYIPGDVYQWTTSQASFTCDVCGGNKVLLVPDEIPHSLAGEDYENLIKRFPRVLES